MKPLRCILCVFLLSSLLLCSSFRAFAVPTTRTLSLSAKSAVLIDADDGRILYESNAREKMGMASTTKIMTALLVAEMLPFDKTVSVPKEAVNVEGSSVYLCEGELLRVEELVYALLLSSANDAAVALAVCASGSIESFAQKMNEKARSLGLCDTSFTNPHGLYNDAHYTTAYDLAIIAKEALACEKLRPIFSARRAEISQGVTAEAPEGLSKRYLYNHNKMLSRYEGAIGMKTGFTKKTGRCLVSAAQRDGLCLIAVTLSAPDDWNDHTRLLDLGFESYERVTLFDAGEFTYCYSVTGGTEDFVTLTNAVPLALTRKKGDDEPKIQIFSRQRFEFAPISVEDELALLVLTTNEKELSSPLIAAHGVERADKAKK